MMDSKIYKGSLEPIILKLRHDQNEVYGYQITQLIKRHSGGKIMIKEGSLYPLLHKMEAKWKIESTMRLSGNRSRKYYHITEKGQREPVIVFNEMSKFTLIMNQLFHPNFT